MSEVSVEVADTGRPASFRDVLAIREFRALFVADELSVIGDQLARIAVAVIVFTRTGSTFLTGLTYAVSYLPWLIGGPLLSGYADRRSRREVMIACDVARTVLLFIMAIPRLPTAALIALVVVVALGEPPFHSARSSLVPDVVGEGDLYATASTLSSTATQFAVVLGFAVGGGLVATAGAHSTLLADALTFAVSGLLTMRYVKRRPAVNAEPGSWAGDLRKGARIVLGDAPLRWLLIISWLLVGTCVSTETVAIPYAHARGAGAGTAGLMIASLPLGVIVGAF